MRWVIGIFICAVLGLQYVLWFGVGGMRALWSLQQRIFVAEQQVRVLSANNVRLTHDIYDLEHGREVLEIQARELLGMVKPGEKFYRVIVLPAKSSNDRSALLPDLSKKSSLDGSSLKK